MYFNDKKMFRPDVKQNYCTDHTPMESMLYFMKMNTFIVKQESLGLSEECDSSTSSVSHFCPNIICKCIGTYFCLFLY